MKKVFTLLFMCMLGFSVFAQETLYTQDFTANDVAGWPISWTPIHGTWTPVATNPSDYIGASGGRSAQYSGSTAGNLIFTGLSTVGYTNITVLWGGYRNGNVIIVTYSIDGGSTWTALTGDNVPSVSEWRLVNGNTGARIALPANAANQANLRFRFRVQQTTEGTSFYQIDDFTIQGCKVPDLFAVTGGGLMCDPEVGVEVGLDGSETGMNYKLMVDGDSVTTVAGTGDTLSFGMLMDAGTYTVEAINSNGGCTLDMEGSVVIEADEEAPVIAGCDQQQQQPYSIEELKLKGLSLSNFNPNPELIDLPVMEADDMAITVICPENAIPENEPCGTNVNGGCNNLTEVEPPIPAAYTNVQTGDVICGNTWKNGNWRDTDWYKLTLSETTDLAVTLTGDAADYLIFILSGDCPASVINSGITGNAGEPSTLTTTLNPGTYVIWVGFQSFDGLACPGSNYVLEIGGGNDIEVNNDPGICGAVVNFDDKLENITDNCGVESVVANPESGTEFPIGTTTVTITATDASGNVSSCNFDVTVTDAEAPVANCKNTTVYLDENGQASITPNAVSSSGNIYFTGTQSNGQVWQYDGNDVTELYSNVSYAGPVGINYVEENGNLYWVNANSQTIMVAPADGSGSPTVLGSSPNDGDILGIDVDYNNNRYFYTTACCGPGGLYVANIDGTGTQHIYTSPSGNRFTGIQYDASGDLIYFSDMASILSIKPDGSLINVLFDGTDGVAGVRDIAIDVTNSKIYWTNNQNSIMAGNIDGSGSPSLLYTGSQYFYGIHLLKSTQTLYWTNFPTQWEGGIDKIFMAPADGTGTPEVVVEGDFGSIRGIFVTEIGNTDNCGIESVTLDKTSFDCSNVGENTVTLTVTDVNGNSSTCTSIVTVVDNIAPIIEEYPAEYIETTTEPGVCEAYVELTEPIASDNCCGGQQEPGDGPAPAEVEIPCLTVTNDAPEANIFPKGETIVTWTVTDKSGNTATCQQTVLVIDDEAPVIGACGKVYIVELKPVTYQKTTVYRGSLPQVKIKNLISDNCDAVGDGLTVVFSQTIFTSADWGTNTETVTVTDSEGNTTSCTITVVVRYPLKSGEVDIYANMEGVEFGDDMTSLNLKAYPNPTTGRVTLVLANYNNPDVNVQVMNVTGQKVFEHTYRTAGLIELDLTGNKSGLYFINVNVDNQRFIEKILLKE